MANLSRRDLLRLLPEGAFLGGAAALSRGRGRRGDAPRLRTIALDGLHAGREDVCILHISDAHLGAGPRLSDFVAALAHAPADVDVVAITGDLLDAPALLEGALAAIVACWPAALRVACLGNHEAGHDAVLDPLRWERAGVTLLRDTVIHRDVRGVRLAIAGLDDPDVAQEQATDEDAALARLPPLEPGALPILLAHRPGAVDRPGAAPFRLCLSGHTHGGQLGLFGRSILDGASGQRRHWGLRVLEGDLPRYAYTTSGMGDWFPFRLGCPRELPYLRLRGTGGGQT